jgi:thiamine-phosphate diphosphorylase
MTAGPRRPIICLVTDRRRVSPPGTRGLLRLIEHAARAGVDLIQLREPSLNDGELLDLARAALAAISATPARLLVNDRPDVALAARAHGVHLREDSISAGRVRAVAPPGFLLGRSVHDLAEAVTAARSGVDYLVAGTVYATRSKPPGRLLGLDGVAEIAAAVDVPVLAIGGVTADTARDLAGAGAAGVAAIGLFADATTGTDGQLEDELRNLLERIHRTFEMEPPALSS